MARALHRVKSIFGSILSVSGVAFMIISLLLVFTAVITRYAFNVSFQWVEELARYSIVYAVLLYVGPLIGDNEHIKMDLVFNKLSGKVKKAVVIINYLIALIASIYILIQGWIWVGNLKSIFLYTSSGLFLAWIPALAVPIGMLFTSLYSVLGIVGEFLTKDSENS